MMLFLLKRLQDRGKVLKIQMTVYDGIKILKSCGWWDVLRRGLLVSPAVEAQLQIYEHLQAYLSKGFAVSDCVIWTADDFETSERWVWVVKNRYSATLPEGVLFTPEMVKF